MPATPAATTTGRADVGGTTLAWTLSGPATAPVVVLSHALAASMALWEPQLPALAPRFRVLRYDLRGHGASAPTAGPYTFERLSDDVAGLLDVLGIGRAHFVGLSIGGMIGQHLALRHPGRIDRLALCSTTSRVPPEAMPQWDQRMAAIAAGGMETQLAATLERWFTPAFAAARPDVMDAIAAQVRGASPAGVIGCAAAIRTLDVTDRLARIRCPTLVMAGELDPGTPPAAAEAIAARIPGARLVVLPGVRHLSNVETPDAFNAALLDFLTGTAAAAGDR